MAAYRENAVKRYFFGKAEKEKRNAGRSVLNASKSKKRAFFQRFRRRYAAYPETMVYFWDIREEVLDNTKTLCKNSVELKGKEKLTNGVSRPFLADCLLWLLRQTT